MFKLRYTGIGSGNSRRKMNSKGFIPSILLTLFFLGFSPESAYAWKFAVLGDTRPGNGYDHSQNVYAITYKIPNSDRVSVFNSGDLTLDGIDSQWNSFRSIISPLGIPTDNSSWTAFGIPQYIAVVGNHDTHQSGWQTRWATYLPAQKGLSAYSDIPAHSQGLYGSVKYNNAIWVWLDSVSLPSGQETFLRNNLERAKNDPGITWKFVMFHYPPVTCGGPHSDWNTGKLWSDNYFVPNGVDIVFTGHNHYYERTCPFTSTSSKTCGANGVVHITTGGGGAETYSTGAACGSWLLKSSRNHHFVEVDIQGNSLAARVWDTDAGVGTSSQPPATANFALLDQFTLNKGAELTPTPTGSTATPTTTPAPILGDFDLNGKVDIYDYNRMVSDFGKTGSPGWIAADIDKNGKVDIYDYNILVENFGKQA